MSPKFFKSDLNFVLKMCGGQSLHVHTCWTMVCAGSIPIIVAVLWLYICDNQLPSLHTKECQQQYMMHCMHWKEDKVGSSIYVIILDESLFYELPFHGKQWPRDAGGIGLYSFNFQIQVNRQTGQNFTWSTLIEHTVA